MMMNQNKEIILKFEIKFNFVDNRESVKIIDSTLSIPHEVSYSEAIEICLYTIYDLRNKEQLKNGNKDE